MRRLVMAVGMLILTMLFSACGMKLPHIEFPAQSSDPQTLEAATAAPEITDRQTSATSPGV
jgi:hypothetical protein